MKLYHGTAARHLPDILANGLKPRGKGTGNWRHSVESCPDAVYLTNSYALHYAYSATKPGEPMVVLEVDTSKLNMWAFAPDEDWLEQVTRKDAALAPIDKPMKYRTRWYRRRLPQFAQFWRESLEGLGNCTYHGTIPPSAITRVATVDMQTYADLVWVAGMDPTVSTLNYRICGPKYRNSMRRLFHDMVELEHDELENYRDPNPERAAKNAALVAETWARVQVTYTNPCAEQRVLRQQPHERGL